MHLIRRPFASHRTCARVPGASSLGVHPRQGAPRADEGAGGAFLLPILYSHRRCADKFARTLEKRRETELEGVTRELATHDQGNDGDMNSVRRLTGVDLIKHTHTHTRKVGAATCAQTNEQEPSYRNTHAHRHREVEGRCSMTTHTHTHTCTSASGAHHLCLPLFLHLHFTPPHSRVLLQGASRIRTAEGAGTGA